MASNHVVFDDAAITELLNSPDGPVGKQILKATLRVEARAKKLASRRGHGFIYKKSNPSRIHQASAPGEPPAPDLGLLRASITHDFGRDEQGLVGRVGTSVKYARYLEYGTSRMAARPFLRPALEAANPVRAAQLRAADAALRRAEAAQRTADREAKRAANALAAELTSALGRDTKQRRGRRGSFPDLPSVGPGENPF